MVFDITQLKKIRKQLGLTQHQFANKAGISQSMIAKIESGKLDPTYTKVKKIEEALDLLTKHHEKTAKELMVKNIISAKPDEKITRIINLMNKHGISQIPVINNEKILGLVSESSILKQEEAQNKQAKEVMEETPPIISENTQIKIIKQLLQFYPIILIKEKGNLKGLITKTDLIKSLI